MPYYALFYELVDDMVNRRLPYRDEHLRLAREARERGELVLAGALAQPVDRALLVFEVDDKSKVESFVRKDPYVTHGLATKWEIRPWNVVVGNEPATSPPTPPLGAILRRWTARTTEAQLRKYLDHFSQNVVPELRRVPGYFGANLSLRRLKSEIEIIVETIWRSLDAIRAFAGSDLEAAVVSEDAATLLTTFDRRVLHSEIALTDRL